MTKRSFVLRIASTDRPGIVTSFSGALSKSGGNITEAQQFNDSVSKRFFARVVFDLDSAASVSGAMETVSN